MGRTIQQGIPLIGWGKASVVTKCKVENGVGWNVASRFGFEFRFVGREAKGERNETARRHECGPAGQIDHSAPFEIMVP